MGRTRNAVSRFRDRRFESSRLRFYKIFRASQLLDLCGDEKRAALGEFSNQKLERRASRAAACENLPSGKLLVGESSRLRFYKIFRASQLLDLCGDEKRAALGEFSNQKLERRASRAAACENLPSGKLLVGEKNRAAGTSIFV